MDGEFSEAHSGSMDTFESLVRAEFAAKNTYLNTASTGLLPVRAVTAMRTAVESAAAGDPTDMFGDVEASRAAFARLVGVPAGRVAAGASVAVYSGLIAASLPAGAEVLTAEGDFSSLVNPFHVRADLKVRSVPLERIAESVHPGTALVAVSAAQSADGRIADLPAIREAARMHGARTYVDASQAAGWLALDADAYDYTACVGFKWLVCPRGVAFLVVPEDLGGLPALFAGWVAGERPGTRVTAPSTNLPTPHGGSTRARPSSPTRRPATPSNSLRNSAWTPSGPMTSPSPTASAPAWPRSATPRPSPGAPIVSVPGLGHRQGELSAAGIEVSDRAGNLRAAFHLYNTADDVDRLLAALSS